MYILSFLVFSILIIFILRHISDRIAERLPPPDVRTMERSEFDDDDFFDPDDWGDPRGIKFLTDDD